MNGKANDIKILIQHTDTATTLEGNTATDLGASLIATFSSTRFYDSPSFSPSANFQGWNTYDMCCAFSYVTASGS